MSIFFAFSAVNSGPAQSRAIKVAPSAHEPGAITDLVAALNPLRLALFVNDRHAAVALAVHHYIIAAITRVVMSPIRAGAVIVRGSLRHVRNPIRL